MEKFTEKQLLDWLSFEKVRSGGAYNMFDPHARFSTGLTKEEYMFVMKNYEQLRDQKTLQSSEELA